MCRADVGWGVSHVDAFSAWIQSLTALTGSSQLFVVWDNKRGAAGGGAAPVAEARRAHVPGYLGRRRAKEFGGKEPGQAAASKALELPGQGRPGPSQRASAALLDTPPSHLAPFVQVVRQRYGGMCLYGSPGWEADDLIAALAAGLLDERQRSASSTARDTQGLASARPATSGAAPATPLTATAAPRVVVASADSDMLQLLALPGAAWLQLRSLSAAAAAETPPPVAAEAAAVPGVPLALMRLWTAAQSPGSGQAPAGAHASAAAGATDAGQDHGQGQAAAAAAEGLLPPSAYADWLALTGKPASGVPGCGLGARAARKLLVRYGSLDDIVRAYDRGELDEQLRVAPVGKAAGPDAGGGEQRPRPAALQQAVRNLRATRLQPDPSAVPWEHVLAYQRSTPVAMTSAAAMAEAEPLAAAVGPSGSSARTGAAGTRAAGAKVDAHPFSASPAPAAGPAGVESSAWRGGTAAAAVHPHDALRWRAAGPFVAALAAALQASGVCCCESPTSASGDGLRSDAQPCTGEDGMTDLWLAFGGAAKASPSAEVSARARAAAQGIGADPALSEAGVTAAAAELVALVASGSPAAAATGKAAAAAAAAAEAETARVKVVVLSPWDFKPLDAGKQPQQPRQRQQPKVPQQPQPQGSAGRQQPGTGPSGPTGTGPGQGAGAGGTGELQRLLSLASRLRGAAGPRKSLVHTPSALLGLLRASSAWRLRATQRGASTAAPAVTATPPAVRPPAPRAAAAGSGAQPALTAGAEGAQRPSVAVGPVVVAVVPWYDLLLGPREAEAAAPGPTASGTG
ncbi:hypothetical protein HYH03_003482 [Edaphochlamys debaryana]|uniref:5'-3' exonuclease domain-containing protein n=1 Tax=Edaphochlamys debaryana TaxID=47281 RepID=A0A835YCH4_9CHLO|nr:hypothetical protein HYH03_003482 [Edaphochlamys debaryana]|eukprot:KAG2498743.1 hypothetical protein HYH03_003482 [Edaphochlamys debaryana]